MSKKEKINKILNQMLSIKNDDVISTRTKDLPPKTETLSAQFHSPEGGGEEEDYKCQENLFVAKYECKYCKLCN